MEDSADKKSRVIVGIGASITAGTPGFLSPREKPPAGEGNPQSQYAWWMEKLHPEWKVLNRGVRGQRTDQILGRYEWEVVPNSPDILIVIGGTNDLYQGYDIGWARDHLWHIYNKRPDKPVWVIACSLPPLNIAPPDVKEKILELNEWIAGYARENALGFCDLYALLEDPDSPGHLSSSPDEIHPDIEGYRKIGEALAGVVEDGLREGRV